MHHQGARTEREWHTYGPSRLSFAPCPPSYQDEREFDKSWRMVPLVDRKLKRAILCPFTCKNRQSLHRAHPIPCCGDDLWKAPVVHNGCGRCLVDTDLSFKTTRARTCYPRVATVVAAVTAAAQMLLASWQPSCKNVFLLSLARRRRCNINWLNGRTCPAAFSPCIVYIERIFFNETRSQSFCLMPPLCFAPVLPAVCQLPLQTTCVRRLITAAVTVASAVALSVFSRVTL